MSEKTIGTLAKQLGLKDHRVRKAVHNLELQPTGSVNLAKTTMLLYDITPEVEQRITAEYIRLSQPEYLRAQKAKAGRVSCAKRKQLQAEERRKAQIELGMPEHEEPLQQILRRQEAEQAQINNLTNMVRDLTEQVAKIAKAYL